MGNPIINALANAQKSQVDTLAARAQFVDTLKSEMKKTAEKRLAQVQEQALTVQQAKQQAQKDATEQQQRAQESILAVMPQPQVVRGDRPGIGQALATSSAGSIGGLENIIGAVSGGPQPSSAGPGDPYGFNASDPTAGGKIGENFSVGPQGTVTQTTRQPIQTGIRAVDLINSIVGASTGGRFPLSATQRTERPDIARQLVLDRAAAEANRVEAERLQRAQDLEKSKFVIQTAEELRKEGVVQDVPQSLIAAQAIVDGRDDVAGKLLTPSKRAELEDNRLRAQTRAEDALTKQRLALARKYDRQGDQLTSDFRSVPLDVLGGIPANRQNGSTRTPNDVSQSFGSGDNSLLDRKGLPRSGKEPTAIDNQRIMFANGIVLAYGVEKPNTGTFYNDKGAAAIPLGDVLQYHVLNKTSPDPAVRKQAADWLVATKVFERPDPKADDVQTVDVTGGYNHPNASPARGIRNLEQLLSTASPEVQIRFLEQFKGGSYLPGQAPKPPSSR